MTTKRDIVSQEIAPPVNSHGADRAFPVDGALLDAERAKYVEFSLACAGRVILDERGRAQEFRVGETAYRLKQPLRLIYSKQQDRVCLSLEGIDPPFRGEGKNEDFALAAFIDRVHTEIQTLLQEDRDGIVSTERAGLWKLVQSAVDVDLLKQSATDCVRQAGRISGIYPCERGVTWVGEAEEERISLDDAPARFATYKLGEWFEAAVEREMNSWKLVRLESTFLLAEQDCLPLDAMEELFEQQPGTSSIGGPAD